MQIEGLGYNTSPTTGGVLYPQKPSHYRLMNQTYLNSLTRLNYSNCLNRKISELFKNHPTHFICAKFQTETCIPARWTKLPSSIAKSKLSALSGIVRGLVNG